MADSLIFNWSKTGVVAVTCTVTGQQVHVRKSAAMKWPETAPSAKNAAAAGKAIKSFLQQAGISADEAVVCLARDAAVTRLLDVPKVPDDELADIVRLQAATRSSQPADQLLIDYLPQPARPGRELGSVVAATLDRNMVESIQKIATAAGIEIIAIGLSSIGLAELAATVDTSGTRGTLVAVAIIDSRLEVSLVREGNIPFLQSAVLTEVTDDSVSAELRRILFSAQQKLGEFEVDRVILFVESGQQRLFLQLQQEYGSQLTVLTLEETPQVQLSGTIPPSVSPTALLCTVGLLLNRAQHKLPAIDFLHPRKKRVARDDSKRKMAIYAAGALTVIALGLYIFFSIKSSLDEEIARLEISQNALNQGLEKGEPILKADADLKEWLDRDVNTLLELEKTQDTLPGTAVAFLNEYQFDVALGKTLGRVNGKGMARDRDVVEQIYRDFDSAGFNVTPAEIETSRRRDADYPAEFSLTLERPAESTTPTPTARTR